MRMRATLSWAENTHDRIQTIYKELFDNYVVTNRNHEFWLREVMVKAELLKRDFTKRQLSIISAIITFSYPYGKASALIPKLKDFALAGVLPTKIASELTKLVNLNVITWERGKDSNEFSINDPREWLASYHNHYNDIRSRELFFLNLKHAGIPLDIEAMRRKAFADE
jgi:hypothetical protein